MAKVLVYFKDPCPYCVNAKRLLTAKGLVYEEIDVTHDTELRAKLVEKAEGRRTVPQIFINDQPIGGFDDLSAKHQSGELDLLLA